MTTFKSRDERQEECRVKWIKNKCRGIIVAPTGVGKTRIALNCIRTILSRYPLFTVIVIVPTLTLQKQWIDEVDKLGYSLNVKVLVINSAVKKDYKCDLLVIDEIHKVATPSFISIFEKIKYRIVLGLTATLHRLDGKEVLIEKYCPVIDTITESEALQNHWISQYKEYLVLLDVPDIENYLELNNQFYQHFEFFNYDFGVLRKLLGPKGYLNRIKLRDIMYKGSDKQMKSDTLKNITFHAMEAARLLQARKSFINYHPLKLEVARDIINSRNNSKIITFSNNIKMAESIGIGSVYSRKTSKKRGEKIIEDFNSNMFGILNTVQKANEGLDIYGLSVAIILGLDSSEIKAIQRRGRVIRFEPNKQAEIFNLVLNDTVEVNWFMNSHKNSDFTTIDLNGLKQVLEHKEPDKYVKKIKNFMFRF